MKQAYVYRSDDGLLVINGMDVTSSGVGLSSPNVWRLGRDASAQEVGAAIVQAFDLGGNIVPHPRHDAWAQVQTAYFGRLGVRSRRELQERYTACALSLEGGLVNVDPTENMGPRGGFQSRESDRQQVPSSDLELLGRSVFAALRASTSWRGS